MKSVNGRWGETWFYENDIYVGRSLEYYGEYNPDETEFILSIADKNKLCIDVGANFGTISQALETSGFQCVSFEPQPDIFEIMSKNVKGEKYNCALGEHEGMGVMPKIPPNIFENYGGMGLGRTSIIHGIIEVPIRTLDSFNFSNVGFIKIDVEGYEEEVLKGAEKLIEEYRPILYIEDNHKPTLRPYILSLGYIIEDHRPHLYRENNFFGYKENIWENQDGPNVASFNLYCKPL